MADRGQCMRLIKEPSMPMHYLRTSSNPSKSLWVKASLSSSSRWPQTVPPSRSHRKYLQIALPLSQVFILNYKPCQRGRCPNQLEVAEGWTAGICQNCGRKWS